MSNPSRNVSFNKPAEPSFLKAFKSKVGYKEPVGIEAKRPTPGAGTPDDGKEVDREDELPTVVVLREGDIGQEEFLKMRQERKDEGDIEISPPEATGVPTVSPRPTCTPTAEATSDTGGKITFKKPTKRRSGDGERGGVLDASSSKRAKQDDPAKESAATVVVGGVTKRRRRSSGGESKSRQVKNSSLLSFGDEEED